jgi:cell division septum initiation protein DivIVA
MSITSGSSSEVDQLLALLNDPERFKKQLGELRATAKMAEEQVALAGPASEIVQLREKLKEEASGKEARQKAHEADCAKTLKAVEDKAKAVVAQAKAQADQIVADASSKLADARKQLENASARQAEVDTVRAELQSLETKLKGIEAMQVERGTSLVTREKAVEIERVRLAGIAKKLQAELG